MAQPLQVISRTECLPILKEEQKHLRVIIVSNPITTAPIAQNAKSSAMPKGIANGQENLASPDETFVDYLMVRIDGMNMSAAEMSALKKDISDGQLSEDSPMMGIIGKLSEQFTLERDTSLSAGNEMFFRELAGLFVNLNAEGDINLSGDMVRQLEKINSGELPANEFVAMLQNGDLFTQLRDAIQDERIHGLAKTATKPEDIHEIATDKVADILTQGDTDPANIEVVLKRLENLLTKVQERLANIASPRSQEALENVATQISGLIARFETKLKNQNLLVFGNLMIDGLNGTVNNKISMEASSGEFIPTRHALLKAVSGKKTAGEQSIQANQLGGSTLASAAIIAKKAAKAKNFSVNPMGAGTDGSWLNPVEGDIGFDAKMDVRGIVADQVQNSLKAIKTANTRTMLPPSPAAQQVLVHIQKNNNNQSRMNIQLNPSELGRVEVRLTVGNDGRTTAVVLAERSETLQLLQRDSAHLEKALQNAGLDVGAQDLSFNMRGDGNDDFKSRRRFERRNENNNGLIGDGIQLSPEQLDAAVFSKNSVNYKA